MERWGGSQARKKDEEVDNLYPVDGSLLWFLYSFGKEDKDLYIPTPVLTKTILILFY